MKTFDATIAQPQRNHSQTVTTYMKKLPLILGSFLVLTSFFWNCESKKMSSETEFGQTVFYEIFPAVLDSIHYDMRLMPPPPIPPDLLEDKGYDIKSENEGYSNAYKKWKESDDYKNMMIDWETRTDSIRRDTTSLFIIVQDSIKYWENKGIEYFRDLPNSTDTLDFSKRFVLDRTKLITNHKNIKFKYRNEFPKDPEFWKHTYKYNVVAFVNFSRIIFDESKSNLILDVSYVKGPLNGSGYKIYLLKTDNGKWIINKIKGTWVS